MTEPRICSDPDCDRPNYGGGLCHGHWERHRSGSTLTGPIATKRSVVGDDVFMPCPDQLLDLAGAVADLDARAIVRGLWSHLLEASLAGLEPFTLQPRDDAA
jgi:hypothetical protein